MSCTFCVTYCNILYFRTIPLQARTPKGVTKLATEMETRELSNSKSVALSARTDTGKVGKPKSARPSVYDICAALEFQNTTKCPPAKPPRTIWMNSLWPSRRKDNIDIATTGRKLPARYATYMQVKIPNQSKPLRSIQDTEV